MRIAIFGAGGVGGYFGGRLAQAGEEVVFIARGEHLRAMQSDGLRVDSPKGNFRVIPIQATDDLGQTGQVDAVILGVKAWQVPAAARAMRAAIGAGTCVLPLQNGVEASGQLAEILGKEHVLGGLCRISSYIAGPGHIAHVGLEPYVALGELDNRSSQRVERLRTALERAGVWVEVPTDIEAAVWAKFLFIAAVSGVTAVTRAPLGVVRSLPETRRFLEGAMQEIFDVASALGIRLAEDVRSKTLAYIDTLPEKTIPSMQRDILEGKPSELEAQNGAVIRLGLAAGIPTPIHTFIYSSLLPAELRARSEIQF